MFQGENAGRLQIVLNGFDLWDDRQYGNTEELASYLDAKGVIAPPCEVGAVVWAYVLSGLCKCKVTKISYDFAEKQWAFFVIAESGFSFCVRRFYSSKEEAERNVNNER